MHTHSLVAAVHLPLSTSPPPPPLCPHMLSRGEPLLPPATGNCWGEPIGCPAGELVPGDLDPDPGDCIVAVPTTTAAAAMRGSPRSTASRPGSTPGSGAARGPSSASSSETIDCGCCPPAP